MAFVKSRRRSVGIRGAANSSNSGSDSRPLAALRLKIR
jgi:hypothetical protein